MKLNHVMLLHFQEYCLQVILYARIDDKIFFHCQTSLYKPAHAIKYEVEGGI